MPTLPSSSSSSLSSSSSSSSSPSVTSQLSPSPRASPSSPPPTNNNHNDNHNHNTTKTTKHTPRILLASQHPSPSTNPFAPDWETEQQQRNPKQQQVTHNANTSTNPFDSDDDDDIRSGGGGEPSGRRLRRRSRTATTTTTTTTTATTTIRPHAKRRFPVPRGGGRGNPFDSDSDSDAEPQASEREGLPIIDGSRHTPKQQQPQQPSTAAVSSGMGQGRSIEFVVTVLSARGLHLPSHCRARPVDWATGDEPSAEVVDVDAYARIQFLAMELADDARTPASTSPFAPIPERPAHKILSEVDSFPICDTGAPDFGLTARSPEGACSGVNVQLWHKAACGTRADTFLGQVLVDLQALSAASSIDDWFQLQGRKSLFAEDVHGKVHIQIAASTQAMATPASCRRRRPRHRHRHRRLRCRRRRRNRKTRRRVRKPREPPKNTQAK